jgi:hypothetical protein
LGEVLVGLGLFFGVIFLIDGNKFIAISEILAEEVKWEMGSQKSPKSLK